MIDANNVWVRDSIIDSNSDGLGNGDGISIRNPSSYNEITDNRITGNAGWGIRIVGNRNVAVRNVVDANTLGQLNVAGSSGNMVGLLQQPPISDPSANIGFP